MNVASEIKWFEDPYDAMTGTDNCSDSDRKEFRALDFDQMKKV
jgi:hypothetical protein